MTVGERNELQGVSLAELEYAYRFADHLTIGAPRPDASGFDRERIATIERVLRDGWNARIRRVRRRA